MKIERLIYQIFTITFITIGTVTNILSAIVYSRKKMRTTSYSTYLFSLALTDLCVTLTGNIRLALMHYDLSAFIDSVYLNNYNGIDLREHSLIWCRLHTFLTYYFTQLSSMVLCFLNLDRIFGVVFTLQALNSRLVKVRCARILILASTVFLLFINSHFLVFLGNFENTNSTNRIGTKNNSLNHSNLFFKTKQCHHSKKSYYKHFWSFYFYIDSTLYCILPFMIMVTSNCLIIGKIVKSRIRANPVIVEKVKNTSKIKIMENKSSTMLGNEKRLSFTLISISVSFLICTMPVFFIENLESYRIVDFSSDFWLTLKALAYMLMYLNHVINFFFYCLLGPKFRNEVKKLIPFFKEKKSPVHPVKFSRRATLVNASSLSVKKVITVVHGSAGMNMPRAISNSSQNSCEKLKEKELNGQSETNDIPN